MEFSSFWTSLFAVLVVSLGSFSCADTEAPDLQSSDLVDEELITVTGQKVVANTEGASALILFGDVGSGQAAPPNSGFYGLDDGADSSSTDSATSPVAGGLFKLDDQGIATPVFDRAFYFEKLVVGGSTAYMDMGGPLYLDVANLDSIAPETTATGIWCRQISFQVSGEIDHAVCLENYEKIEDCTDPNNQDAQIPGGVCNPGIPFAAVDEDGVVWLVQLTDLASFDGTFRAVRGAQSYEATPIILRNIKVFEPTPAGVIVQSNDGIEYYYFDDAADQVKFERYNNDIRLYHRTAVDALGDYVNVPRWGDRIMLESEPINVDDRQHRFLNITNRLVESPLTFDPPLAPSVLRSGDGFTDGQYLYVRTMSDATSTYWRCDTDGGCAPVNVTDTTKLADFYPESSAGLAVEYGDGGGLGWAIGTDRIYLAAEGHISENLADKMVVRELQFLGDRLHILGVDADTNVGGLFSVQFDTVGKQFTFTQIETFGLDVVELVEVVTP